MTGRRYFGQQQVVDLLSYLRLLHNRYDDEALLTVLASPFVGVSNDALVLIRAGAERRPIFKGIERTLPPDLADDDRRLVRAFQQRYDRLVGGVVTAVARAALRAHRGGARLRPRRAGPPRRAAPLREPPQARPARALVRRAARARHRGLCAFRRRAGGGRRARARCGLGGGRGRCGAVAHDPHGEGPRVQGRRRSGRRPRPQPGRRDPLPLRRSLRLQGRPPRHRLAGRHDLLPGGQGRARARGRGRAAAPLLRRHDARHGQADRVRIGRPRERAPRAHADRVGARAARARAGAAGGRRRPGRGREGCGGRRPAHEPP